MIKENAIKAVFSGSLKLRSEESLLAVTDTVKEPIGKTFYEFAKKITDRTKLIVIDPTSEHGAEPPEETAREMLQYDVQILVTEKSLTHTRARREATSRGARIAVGSEHGEQSGGAGQSPTSRVETSSTNPVQVTQSAVSVSASTAAVSEPAPFAISPRASTVSTS